MVIFLACQGIEIDMTILAMIVAVYVTNAVIMYRIDIRNNIFL